MYGYFLKFSKVMCCLYWGFGFQRRPKCGRLSSPKGPRHPPGPPWTLIYQCIMFLASQNIDFFAQWSRYQSNLISRKLNDFYDFFHFLCTKVIGCSWKLLSRHHSFGAYLNTFWDLSPERSVYKNHEFTAFWWLVLVQENKNTHFQFRLVWRTQMMENWWF